MRLTSSLGVALVLVVVWLAATAAEPARFPFNDGSRSSRAGSTPPRDGEQVASSSSVTIARAEIDLRGAIPTILLEGSDFCAHPEVTMGSPGGSFNVLFVVSATETSILAELVDTTPATYVVRVDCEPNAEIEVKAFGADDDDDSSSSGAGNDSGDDDSDDSSSSDDVDISDPWNPYLDDSDDDDSSGDCSGDDCSGSCCPGNRREAVIDVTISPGLDGGECPAGHCVIAVDESGMIVCGECGGEPFGPQACPEGECVIAVDSEDSIVCGDCGTPVGPQRCPRGQCMVGLDANDVIICGECRGSDEPSCAFVEEARIGSWCIDRFQRSPANFLDATIECHEDRKVICPVEAMVVCDVVEPSSEVPEDGGNEFQVDPGFSQCSTLTDDSNLRFWTSTLEPSFDPEVFQGIVIYGGDNRMRMGEANELHSYFCCKPADRFVPLVRAKRGLTRKSETLRETTGALPSP